MFGKEKMESKRKSVRFLITAAVVLCMLTACGFGNKKETSSEDGNAAQENTVNTSGGEENGSQSSKVVIPEDSILNFQNDSGFARLQSDMKSGNFPVECNVLYDEEGSRPDVTVTDAAVIRNIYGYLADVTVGDKTDLGVTDSYHHVSFRLRNDTYVSFYFEGENYFCWGKDNYSVSGGQDLWRYVRQLQDTAMAESERKAARDNGNAGASNTGEAAASAGSSKEKTVTQSTQIADLGGNTSEDTEGNRESAANGTVGEMGKDDYEQAPGQEQLEGASGHSDDARATGTGSGSDAAVGELDGSAQKDVEDIPPGGTQEAGTGNDSEGDNTYAQSGDQGQTTDTSVEPVTDTTDADGTEDTDAGTETVEDADTTQTDEAVSGTGTGEDADMTQIDDSASGTETDMDPAAAQTADDAYAEIVRAYEEALSQDGSAFTGAYGEEQTDGDDGDAAENAGGEGVPATDPRLNDKLLYDYFTYPGQSVYYGKHDYNADGIQELVIAIGNAETKIVREVYTFDGEKAVRLLTGRFEMGQRAYLEVLPDSAFRVRASGGASSGYEIICRIAADRSGMEVIAEYEYDEAKYGSMDHVSPTGERLTMEEFNERYGNTSDPATGITFTAIGAS